MLVCHCNVVSDKDIKKYKNLKEVRKHTKATTTCGGCTDAVKEILEEQKCLHMNTSAENANIDGKKIKKLPIL